MAHSRTAEPVYGDKSEQWRRGSGSGAALSETSTYSG